MILSMSYTFEKWITFLSKKQQEMHIKSKDKCLWYIMTNITNTLDSNKTCLNNIVDDIMLLLNYITKSCEILDNWKIHTISRLLKMFSGTQLGDIFNKIYFNYIIDRNNKYELLKSYVWIIKKENDIIASNHFLKSYIIKHNNNEYDSNILFHMLCLCLILIMDDKANYYDIILNNELLSYLWKLNEDMRHSSQIDYDHVISSLHILNYIIVEFNNKNNDKQYNMKYIEFYNLLIKSQELFTERYLMEMMVITDSIKSEKQVILL